MQQKLEAFLKKHLMEDIEFSIEKNVIRKGKITMFDAKDFHAVVFLSTTGLAGNACDQQYRIPYPFSVTKISNTLYQLDYRIKNSGFDIDSNSSVSPHRFLNRVVSIKIC